MEKELLEARVRESVGGFSLALYGPLTVADNPRARYFHQQTRVAACCLCELSDVGKISITLEDRAMLLAIALRGYYSGRKDAAQFEVLPTESFDPVEFARLAFRGAADVW